jgi:predicted Zn-dependent peptidase
MKRLLAPLLGLLLATPTFAQQVEPEVFVLDNGMTFLLLPRAEQPNAIAAGWVAKVGSVNERPGITGISHFFEHMMFKGTTTIGTENAQKDAELSTKQHEIRGRLRALHLGEQYARATSGEIDDPWDPKHDTEAMKALRAQLNAVMEEQRKFTKKNEFDAIYSERGGTRMNAFTSHDVTFYFIQVPSNKVELWAWMESDRLHDSVFREFYSERDVVHEERRRRTESTPTGIFREQFEAMFWQSSPYSWPVIGWPSDLNSYTYDQATAYYATYYRPNNLVGVLVGDFELEPTKKIIRRYFSRLEAGEPPPPVVTIEAGQTAEKRLYAECDAAPRVQVRYHSVPFGHADEAPLELMASLLNGRTGRLYRSLVEGKEIATRAGTHQDSRKYGGGFSFSASCKGDAKPEDLEDAWYAELKRLGDEPVGERELQKVKNQIRADVFRGLGDNFSLMYQLGIYEAMGGWEYMNTYPAKLSAVTPADIQRVAKEYFAKGNRCVAVYTRKAGTKAEPEDPRIATFPESFQEHVRSSLRQLKALGLEELEQNVTALKAQIPQVPPQVKPILEFLLERAEARLAELKK